MLLSLRKSVLLSLLVLALPVGLAADKIASIHPTGYVTDLAGVVDSGTTERLEALCTEVEQKTGAQIAVVTVKSLDNQDVDNYAKDLFKALGVGDKKDKRGILVLLAPNDRKYRIEVGYGLEAIIVDAKAGDIGRSMVPLLRQGDTSGAVEQAVARVASLIAADRGVTLTGLPRYQPRRDRGDNSISPVAIFAIIFVVFLVLKVLSHAGRGGGPGVGGGGGGLWWILPMLLSSGGGGRGDGGGGFGGSSGGFGGGFGGFGGGSSGGGGASGSW